MKGGEEQENGEHHDVVLQKSEPDVAEINVIEDLNRKYLNHYKSI